MTDKFTNAKRSEGNLSYPLTLTLSLEMDSARLWDQMVLSVCGLAETPNGILVGQQVWDGVGKKVPIVSEITS